MTFEEAQQILGDPGAMAPATTPSPGTPRKQAPAGQAPQRRIPTSEETSVDPFAGTDIPGASNFIDWYKQKRSQWPWLAQLVTPADTPEAMAMLATGFMGPATAELGGATAIPAYRFARNALTRIGTSALAGGVGAKLEDKPFAYGAVKGGLMGTTSEGIYAAQRGIGVSRLGEFLKNEVPKRLSAVTSKFAPWLPTFKNASDFVRSIAQPNREGTGAKWLASNKFQGAIDEIDKELGRNGAQAFAPRPMPVKSKIQTPQTFRGALDTVDLLGELAYTSENRLKRGMTPNMAIRARRGLIEDIENHLGHFRDPQGNPLDTLYSGAREQYGRAKGIMRFLTQPGVVAEGKIQRAPLQKSYMEMAQEGLDLDAKWKPGELDELERAIFGGASPTATDLPGRSSRLRATLPTPHRPVPAVFADAPRYPVFIGEKPLAPYTQPQTSHLIGQRGLSALMGNAPGRQQPAEGVLMPDAQEQQGGVSAGGEISPDVMQAIRSHPDLQGLSDDEIRQLYQQAQQR